MHVRFFFAFLWSIAVFYPNRVLFFFFEEEDYPRIIQEIRMETNGTCRWCRESCQIPLFHDFESFKNTFWIQFEPENENICILAYEKRNGNTLDIGNPEKIRSGQFLIQHYAQVHELEVSK